MNEGGGNWGNGRRPEPDSGLWLLVALALLAWTLAALTSCGTARTVYAEGPERTVTEYRDRVFRDTVETRESVFVSVAVRGDTVWLERNRWRTVERVRWRTDSLYLRDSVRVTVRVPVEKELTRLERTRMAVGKWTLWALGGAVFGCALWLVARKLILRR